MGTTFLGQPMSQNWNDFAIWEEFFNTCRVETFIELGTGNGGMSTYFALQCAHRNILFHTFDHQTWFNFDEGVPKFLNLKSRFHFFDLFSEVGTRAVTELIQAAPKPMAIFFDDGNKPREWKTFAHLTSPGDYCIVHDWGTEFMPEDVGDVPVARILEEMSDLRPDGWKAMWFRRI